MSFKSFDDAFWSFLDQEEYEEAEAYLFCLGHIAFSAGWRAAQSMLSENPHLLESDYFPRKKEPGQQ